MQELSKTQALINSAKARGDFIKLENFEYQVKFKLVTSHQGTSNSLGFIWKEFKKRKRLLCVFHIQTDPSPCTRPAMHSSI